MNIIGPVAGLMLAVYPNAYPPSSEMNDKTHEAHIKCVVHGTIYEYVKSSKEWHFDSKIGRLVIQDEGGWISFPQDACKVSIVPKD